MSSIVPHRNAIAMPKQKRKLMSIPHEILFLDYGEEVITNMSPGLHSEVQAARECYVLDPCSF